MYGRKYTTSKLDLFPDKVIADMRTQIGTLHFRRNRN